MVEQSPNFYGIVFTLQDKFEGTVKWLEGWPSYGYSSNPQVLIEATKPICQACPLINSCRPQYGVVDKKLHKGLVVSGGDIGSKKCRLLHAGVSDEQYRKIPGHES